MPTLTDKQKRLLAFEDELLTLSKAAKEHLSHVSYCMITGATIQPGVQKWWDKNAFVYHNILDYIETGDEAIAMELKDILEGDK